MTLRLSPVLCLVVACSSPPREKTAGSEAALGLVTIAVGEELRELPFSQVVCTADGDVERVELLYQRDIVAAQGRPYRPRVLVARIRGTELLEAFVSAPDVTFAGHDYPSMQLVAKAVAGAPEPSCRLERSEKFVLACNKTTVVPWLAQGPRPQPSFKAEFRCP